MSPLGYRWLFVLSCLFFVPLSDCLLPGEKNVCSRPRLTKVSDVYPSNWTTAWDCESFYPEISCDRIRSGDVALDSVYFVQEVPTCCPGWRQSEERQQCDEACQPGYFGENCAFKCRCLGSSNRSNCDVIDGSCDCIPGWTGRECDQRCDPELGCISEGLQLRTCENGGTFLPAIESCLCEERYDGKACEIPCPTSGTECGQVRCEACISANREHCDHAFNACSCKNGWTGRYCTDPCPSGSEGPFCKEKCCSGNGLCVDGGCLCNDGYYGDECQEGCPDGYFGGNCTQECSCPSSSSCDPVTGQCPSCPFGFKGKGCTQRCSPTEWGASCVIPCSCNSVEGCEVFSGQCGGENDLQISLIIVLAVACALLAVILFTGLACCLCHHRFKKKRSTAISTSDNNVTGDRRTENVLTVDGCVTEGRDDRSTTEADTDHPDATDYERNFTAQGSLYHHYEDMGDVPTLPPRVRLQGARVNEMIGELTDMSQSPHYAHAIYTVR